MSEPATQKTGADPDVEVGEVEKVNPRQAAIDAMTARMEEARERELDEAIQADPGLAANQARIDQQIAAANLAAQESGELQPPPEADGAASREPMHPPQQDSQESDPLAEFIVVQDGQPMFQTKVNGQMRLIPLAEARKQLQIGSAAEIRMQNAAQVEKTLLQRQQEIETKERALAQRMQTPVPPVPAQPDLSEADLLDEAREIFSTAFTGTEEDAAKKLAKTLAKIKSNAVPTVQPIKVDENAIVRKAANAAVMAIQNVSKDKDLRAGYAQFQTEYPDIMADPNLFRMADDMTDVIAQEHPDWAISKVMDEAGKRTRSWVTSLRGDSPDTSPKTNTPTITQTHPNRQNRKDGLVRMPSPAASAVHQEIPEPVEGEQSPQEAFAELKKARGQPT